LTVRHMTGLRTRMVTPIRGDISPKRAHNGRRVVILPDGRSALSRSDFDAVAFEPEPGLWRANKSSARPGPDGRLPLRQEPHKHDPGHWLSAAADERQPAARLTDGSIRDRAAVSPAVARPLFQE
jgi:hypothetical protein